MNKLVETYCDADDFALCMLNSSFQPCWNKGISRTAGLAGYQPLG